MHESDTQAEARKYAQSAHVHMEKRGIPATPNNYQVWYAYAAQSLPDLSVMIDELDRDGDKFTDVVCADLHRQFFTTHDTDDALNDIVQRLQVELGDVVSFVGTAGEGTSEYAKSLSNLHQDLVSSNGVDGIKTAIAKLITATHGVEKTNMTLNAKLAKTSKEVSEMRGNLDTLRQEAFTDGLTGIANRRKFDMELKARMQDAFHDNSHLCLMLLDIDFFKKFNDTYGHQTGDLVLKLLAGILDKSIRHWHTAARYGGEEFAIIMPDTNVNDARQLAEDIRVKVSTHKLVNRSTNQNLGKITISSGISQFAHGETLEELIKRADKALYAAKDQGRNRVVTY
ncbi:MAG: GGDEF domain-containing protein [Alphaproteobacteria bacterium]|nr:GGDEF domain-containing protein [Alphaproteobacteria bacterium]MBF0251828.1 GGDEF domain-containing protein [Alphaproteobacteria bacterium]